MNTDNICFFMENCRKLSFNYNTKTVESYPLIMIKKTVESYPLIIIKKPILSISVNLSQHGSLQQDFGYNTVSVLVLIRASETPLPI